MTIAVVMPYFKEDVEELMIAHRSVSQQIRAARHIIVADGHPNPAISAWACEHIILPSAHRDAGNFARGIGALHAFQTGAEYVCFLDADNWLENNHVSSLYEHIVNSGADIGVSRRILRRLDRSVLDPFDWESDGAQFADTGTVMLSRSALDIAALWATMPVQLSGAGDRVIWAAISQRGFRVVRTEQATTNYKTKWAVHYTGRGEAPPPGTVDLSYVRSAHEYWRTLPEADRSRLLLGRPHASVPDTAGQPQTRIRSDDGDVRASRADPPGKLRTVSDQLHVAIDARVPLGSTGGVAEVIHGLITHLHHLSADDFRFSLIVDTPERYDLRAILPEHCGLLPVNVADLPVRTRDAKLIGTPVTKRVFKFEEDTKAVRVNFRDATGFLRAAGVAVVHSLAQSALDSDLPLLYHPHDLQHLHLPQFFSDGEIEQREILYQYFCQSAKIVPVASRWIAEDLQRQYRLPPEKLPIIPLAPPAADRTPPTAAEMRAICDRLRVQPSGFLLYPAAGWEHKNHIGLLEAAAILRSQGIEPPLMVFTGAFKSFSLQVLERAAALNVTDCIRWAGYITQRDLVLLYHLARGVVVPTKFEAGNCPIWEAFNIGCPVASSNVTSLPSLTNGGALLFDPNNSGEIASAIFRLWSEAPLREQLAARGREVVAPHTGESMVRRFGVLYRRAAGRLLSRADEALLAAGPIV
jgi:glycosyltransferase involved in cell wall biosynthesis